MFKYIKYLCFASIFIFLIIFPAISIEGASRGLLLWFHIIIPNLLPFLILTKLIISLNILPQKSSVLYNIIIGLICGYPVGATNIVDSVENNTISVRTGNFLLAFCNNTSPMFITGYIITSQFQDKNVTPFILIPIYASILITGIISFMIYKPSHKHILIQNKVKKDFFTILDSSIMSALEIIAKIGGYMIIFSILSNYIELLLPALSGKEIIIGLLEITTGINYICGTNMTLDAKIVLINAIAAFGGLCVTFQTISIIAKSELSSIKYVCAKVLNSIISILITILLLKLF